MKKLLSISIAAIISCYAYGQKYFTKYTEPIPKTTLEKKKITKAHELVKVDLAALRAELSKAPREVNERAISEYGHLITLPVLAEKTLSFKIADLPVLSPEDVDKFPEIKTYTGQCVEHPSYTLKLDVTPHGLHGAIFTDSDIIVIDPVENGSDVCVIYNLSELPIPGEFKCLVDDKHRIKKEEGPKDKAAVTSLGTTRREYLFAVGTNQLWRTFYGGTNALAYAAVVTKTNRLNGIYERDFAVRMVMVQNGASLMGIFSGNTAPSIESIHSSINSFTPLIGTYNIGHYFGVTDLSTSNGGFNGLARLGVVCSSTQRGEAFSQAGAGAIDNPWVDFGLIPHEVGHQFDADHTFNSDCSGNRAGATAYEPGAGNSIMSYWFGCEHGTNDGSLHSFFHSGSWFQVSNFTTTGGNGFGCATLVSTGNNAPSAGAGINYSIPRSTPIILSGTSLDELLDAPSLTRSWDQIDVGPITAPNSPTGNAPLFRMRPPSTSGTRFLPVFSSVLNNTSTVGEVLPSYARRFRMAFLVRDNRAGSGATRVDTASYYVVNTPAAFSVTAPVSSSTVNQNQNFTVTWNVANTNLAPINITSVVIELSINNGATFTGLMNTFNDGSESVSIPNGTKTTNARIRIRAAGNIFYALSQKFTIQGNGDCFPPSGISSCFDGLSNTPIQSFRITNSANTVTLLSNLNTGCGTFAGNGAYSDFASNTNFRPTMSRGISYRLVSTGVSGRAMGYGYYIDLNNDGSFDGSTEYLGGTNPATGDVTFNWTVPTSYAEGFYRLRIRGTADRKPLEGEACDFINGGEVEDYLIFVSNYCSPNYSAACSGDVINSFTLNGITNNSSGCQDNGRKGNYKLYTGPSLYANSSYSFSIVNGGTFNQRIGIWIDFNNDFDFDDAGEFVYASPTSALSHSGSFTIPAGIAGVRRMRVRTTDGSQSFAAGDACATRTFGETEEYNITIWSRGTIASGNHTVCNGGDPNNITISTLPGGTGPFAYQWFSAPGLVTPPALSSTAGWTAISGATSASYDPPAGVTANITYACRITPSGHPAGWVNSQRQVTVRPALNFGTLTAGNESFTGSGDPANITFATAPSGGSGSFVYQWYQQPGIHPAPTGTVVPSGWTAITGATSSSYNPPVQNASVSYAVMVDATGTPDCAPFTWASGVRQITIIGLFNPGTIASGNQVGAVNGLCNPADPANITFATLPPAGSTFQWFYRTGLVDAPANNATTSGWITISGATASSYDPPSGLTADRTFGCRVTNGGVTQWATGVRQVEVLKLLTPGLMTGPELQACAGINHTYTVPVAEDAANYNWTVPTGTTVISGANTNSITVRFPTGFVSGNMVVNVSNKCGTSGNRSLTVRGIPATPGTMTGPINAACPGINHLFEVPAVLGATSYSWTLPAGTTVISGATTNAITVRFPAGFISGNMSVVASNTCGTSTARTTTVRGIPAQPGTITGSAGAVCNGNFVYSIAAVTGATGYVWTPPAGTTIVSNTGTSITLNASSGFVSGTLSVSASNTCGTGAARTLALTGAPSTPVSITGPNPACANASGLIYSTPAVTGAASYSWVLPTGVTALSGLTSTSITVKWGTSAGTLRVSSVNACGSSAQRNQYINVATCMAGFNGELNDREVMLYPNPGTGEYTISYNGFEEEGKVQVFNMLGKLVYSTTVPAMTNELPINLKSVPAGTYLLKFENGDFNKTIKVIKE